MYVCYLKTYIILQNNLKYDNTFQRISKISIISVFLYNAIENFIKIQKKADKNIYQLLHFTILYTIF